MTDDAERPRRIEPIAARPVREQAIIYLVNRLRKAFNTYVNATNPVMLAGAKADFERASAHLELIGIPADDSNPRR